MYSEDEINTVVEQLVRTSVRRDYDDLGVRRTDRTFSDIQEVSASVFLLYPSTPYYLAYLCSNKIRGAVGTLSSTLSELSQRVAVLRKRSLPVRDLSSLVNARVALLELEGAGVANVQDAPAWKRVNENLSRFLSRVGSNVKLNGAIVVTAEQARAELTTYVTLFKEQATELKRLVTQLTGAVNDYNKADLARYSRSVFTNARLMLTDTITTFEGLDDAGRLAALRDAVLKVAAMRGIVRDYGTFTGVTPLVLTGTATPFSDSERPALPAVLELAVGPYALMFGLNEEDSTNALSITADASGDGVRFEGAITSSNSSPNTLFTRASGSFIDDGVVSGDMVDVISGASDGARRRVQSVAALVLTCSGPTLPAVGVASIRVVRSPNLLYLSPSYASRLEGLLPEPYDIVAGVNDNLQFSIDGGAVINTPLTAGERTAAEIVTDIDTALNADGFQGEAYFSPLYFDGPVSTLGNDLSLTAGTFPATITIGDEVDIYFGDNQGLTRTVTVVGASTLTVDGAALLTSLEDRIRVGPALRKVRVVPISPIGAVENKRSLKLVLPTAVERSAGLTLGFYGQLLSQSRPTDAANVVTFINGSTKLATASIRKEPRVASALIRTEPSSVSRLVVYKKRTTASFASGTNVTFTLADAVDDDVEIGDELVLREGLEPGTIGFVTAVTDDTVTATMNTAITAATDALIEIGEPSLLEADDVIEIADGQNQGRYYIDSIYGPSFEVTIRGQVVPLASDGFNDPILATGSVDQEGIDLSSKTTDVTSTLEVYDPLHVFFSSDGPHQATATTTYIQLPTSKGVEEGDVLELYTTGSVTPDVTATIETVFEDGVVGLDVAIDATVEYTMAEGRPQAAPSAVLRKVHTYNFDAFKDALDAWLARAPWRDLNAYFTDLNRLINPLLVNQNPTEADIGSAENKVNALAGTLTIELATSANLPTLDSLEAIFDTYTVDRVHEVDALLRTLQERGSDRAVDLLLECQFTTFFGVTLEEASYGGAFQKAMRDVAMNDLPISRIRRVETTEAQSTEVLDTDYEYSLDDIDTSVQVDPPVYNTD